MTDTQQSPQPERSRSSAATWMAATGAFLLVAAAAVFVAVRWSEIPEAGKLALLGAITGAAIIAGRTLRTALPATAGVLVHLGVFLVPVDVAAASLRFDVEWPVVLLVDGLVATATFAWFAHLERSVVLRWATTGGVIASALGLAAVAGIPAPLTLAALALGLVAARRFETSALTFAGVAAVTPLVGAALVPFVRLGTVTDTLMVTDAPSWPFAIAAGVLGAVALGWIAHRRQQLWPLAIAVVGLVAHGAWAWTGLALDGTALLVAAASAFVLIEVLGLVAQRDAFFARPARVVAIGTEVLIAPLALIAALTWITAATLGGWPAVAEWVTTAPFFLEANPTWATALGLVAVGFVVARVRSRDELTDLALTTVGATAVIGGAAALSGATPWIVAVTTGIVAVAGFLPRRAALSLWSIPAALAFVPMSTDGRGVAAIAAALFLVSVVMVHRARGVGAGVALVGALAVGVVPFAAFDVLVVALGYVAATAALAWGLERWSGAFAWVARSAIAVGVAALVPVFVVHDAIGALVLALVITAVSAFDTARLRSVVWSIVPGLGVVASVLFTAAVFDAPVAVMGFALVALGAVAAIVACIDDIPPLRAGSMATAIGAVSIGLPMALLDPQATALSIIVIGSALVGIGVVRSVTPLVPVGVIAMIIGLWVELDTQGVTVSEAYVTPVAVALVALGAWTMHRKPSTSSWVAYGPALGLALGSGLIERFAGGGGWHSVYVGVIAVGAIGFGAYRRLAAPLFLGTAAIIALTVRETLDVTAGVPTWGWLALGGAVLLGGGIVLERTDTSPAEAGRRLVDVVSEQYG